jgi:hypothetical protein
MPQVRFKKCLEARNGNMERAFPVLSGYKGHRNVGIVLVQINRNGVR